MSVLTKSHIIAAMKRRSNGLVITPLLSPNDQLSGASVDVRLGTEFILFRKRTFSSLDLKMRVDLRATIRGYQEKIRIQYRQPFILHPNQFALGSTLEYVKLPNDLVCYCLGRSSWGRVGLVIETASFVAPNFRGCITLELTNVGEVPIVLYPGVRIAQLVFHSTIGSANYTGRYEWPTGPQFSRVHLDEDIAFWCPSAEYPTTNRGVSGQKSKRE